MGSVASQPSISIIIPTYNRRQLLVKALQVLAQRGSPTDSTEILVVDDGSSDGTPEAIAQADATVIVLMQNRLGATRARNAGAQSSQGKVLIFMDDDIEPLPGAIASLLTVVRQAERTIATAALVDSGSSLGNEGVGPAISLGGVPHHSTILFTECFTGLLCIRREDFFALGMFQDPTGGWPNWDDVDFGYRAYQSGFNIVRCNGALAIHHDLSAASLSAKTERWFQASKSAVALFRRYPGMEKFFPMFVDKLPVGWGNDSPAVIIRKYLRAIASSPIILRLLEKLHGQTINRAAGRSFHSALLRWIVGGYMYHGFRQGLKEYGGLVK